MKTAVVGGGINGLASAWALARAGHEVTLFERDGLMGETSSASTKLLHGGLRYLEHGQIRLVYEALRERNWWLRQVPDLTHPLRLVVPVYRTSSRPRWKLKTGLWLYDRLAGRDRIGSHQWLGPGELTELAPDLDATGLMGGYAFYDGQMDDYRLGLWVANQVRGLGGAIHEGEAVARVDTEGGVVTDAGSYRFDAVANVAGPWAEALNERSGVPCGYHLDLIRGSHLLFEGEPGAGFLLESPRDGRAFFALPYQGRRLVGTTEVRQDLDQPIACSQAERDYLLEAHNHYFREQRGAGDIVEAFAGVRPLIRSSEDPTKVSREHKLECRGRLVTVYGGKWTTARRLGEKVAERLKA